MANLTAARAESTFPVFQSHAAGQLCVAMGTIAITTNPTIADVWSMCKVPAGATVVGGYFYASDMDTNATETIDFDVGWAANDDEVADPDGFGNFGVQTGDAITELKPSGVYLPLQGVLFTAGPKTFTAETTLTVTAVAAAATFAAGQATLVVHYFVT
jgi:hypothetical protein